MEQFLAVKRNFLKFGKRLSLGLDFDSYTGKADVNMWITNARFIQTVSYGVAAVAEDSEEI